ncbi:MAG: B12-binding domain-containing radical SAM protein, partial [Firmicutes bacterium]|nr:B12-binding domain-containing radical SAM protein [Bacillota bacterium]
MKILLTTLNSKYVHSNLALKYLYAVAQPWASHVELKEYTINNTSDYVFGELIRGEYDVICFSCYIWNIRQICDLAENIKRARP